MLYRPFQHSLNLTNKSPIFSTSVCQSSGKDVHWIEDIGPILEALSQMTWKEWGMYRQYVTVGLIRDWLEQVA